MVTGVRIKLAEQRERMRAYRLNPKNGDCTSEVKAKQSKKLVRDLGRGSMR